MSSANHGVATPFTRTNTCIAGCSRGSSAPASPARRDAPTLARRAARRPRGRGTTASGPLRGALATRSGRLAGTVSRLRSRRGRRLTCSRSQLLEVGGSASSASGLASASVFATGRPCTTSRTASSLSLLLRVRGRSATAMIFAGTWRGDAPVRTRRRISATSSSVSSTPSAQHDEAARRARRRPTPARSRGSRPRRRPSRPAGRSRRCRCARRRG